MHRSNPITIKSKHLSPHSRYVFFRTVDYHIHMYFGTQISALINIQDWVSRNDKARQEDQKVLYDLLTDLQSNQNSLRAMFCLWLWKLICGWLLTCLAEPAAQNHSLMAMVVSLQKKIEELPRTDREHGFISHSIRYLSTLSGRQIRAESWMITSLDVEFGSEIGSGG